MMSRASHVLMRAIADGLFEPTAKRLRAVLGEEPVVDTTNAMLVWEPRRIVPSYAVPIEDVTGALLPVEPGLARAGDDAGFRFADAELTDIDVLHPGIPFSVHTLPGEALSVQTRRGNVQADAAAFRPETGSLAGYVILDFDAFDAWYEEDERVVSHPRSPFHRIDILHSSRHIRVELDGELLAESDRPYLLFETFLPVRFYLPTEDVREERFRPSDTRTFCAYKGEASYWSLDSDRDGDADVSWSYQHPLREAAEITDRRAFFNERVDITVDGVRLLRPHTPWS